MTPSLTSFPSIFLLLFHSAVVLPVSTLPAPQWPQFAYNAQRTNGANQFLPSYPDLYPLGPGLLNISLTTFPTSRAIYSTGIIDIDGILFIASMDGNLRAIDTTDEYSLRYSLPLLGTDSMLRNNDNFGPESSSIAWTNDCGYGKPCIFYSSYNQSSGAGSLVCAEAHNGATVWYWDPISDANCPGGGFSSPTIVGSDGLLYLSCYSSINSNGVGESPIIMQMPQESGDLNWYFPLDGLSVGNPAACYLDDSNNDYYVLVTTTAGTLSSFDPNQEKKVWSSPLSQFKFFDKSAAGPSSPVCVSALSTPSSPSSPLNLVYTVVTCANYELCTAQNTATLVAVDVTTGKVVFNVSSGGYNYTGSPPVVSSCGLATSSGGNVHTPVIYIVGSRDTITDKLKIVAVNASTGAILLDFVLHDVQANEGMGKTNAVLTCTVDKSITRTYLYFATDHGNIYGVNIENQTVSWTVSNPTATDTLTTFISSPILGRQVPPSQRPSPATSPVSDNPYPGFLIIGSPDADGTILSIAPSGTSIT